MINIIFQHNKTHQSNPTNDTPYNHIATLNLKQYIHRHEAIYLIYTLA